MEGVGRNKSTKNSFDYATKHIAVFDFATFFFTECSCSIEMHRVISYRNTLTHQCHQCIWWVSGVGCSSKVDPEWERKLAKIFVCQILFGTWKSMHRMCCNVYIIVVVSSNWREEKRKQKKHQRQHETTFNTFDTIVSFALTWVWIVLFCAALKQLWMLLFFLYLSTLVWIFNQKWVFINIMFIRASSCFNLYSDALDSVWLWTILPFGWCYCFVRV